MALATLLGVFSGTPHQRQPIADSLRNRCDFLPVKGGSRASSKLLRSGVEKDRVEVDAGLKNLNVQSSG